MNRKMNLWWLFSVFAMNLVEQPAPDVTIEQGTVRGKVSEDGTYLEYLGIPYGTVNRTNRFKAPYPAPSWSGTLHATGEHHSCPQTVPVLGYQGAEDCLKINVYVPTTAHDTYPVLVYIHGGGFKFGTGGKMLYAPDFLVKKDVIVVTFNYRVGILGFLCLHLEEAPGNAGLRDQVAALRWVKKNIAAFRGDPDKITIYGESAGGASTSLMVASRATEGLFKRAIMSSGASTGSWPINRQPVETAALVAKQLGFKTKDPKELYKIFITTPYQELVKINMDRPVGHYLETELMHVPCVEKVFPDIEPIIDDLPYNLMKNYPKNISIIHGTNSMEALFLLRNENEKRQRKRNKQFLFSTDLDIPDVKTALGVSAKIRQFYYGNETMSMKNIMKFMDYLTDAFFETSAKLESELLLSSSKTRKVYNYYFNYAGDRNYLKILLGYGDLPGACHADDTMYVFKGRMWPFRINNEDQKIIDLMTTMWTNFVKYDDPSPDFDTSLSVKWMPSTRKSLNFLYIDKEIRMGPPPRPKNYQLWKSLYENYRRTKYEFGF